MARFALGVEYDGGGFLGWQRLSKPGVAGDDTVQQALETALSSVANTQVDTVCAGRTDAGVHAACQVVHFETDVQRDVRGWMLGTTSRLPPSAIVTCCSYGSTSGCHVGCRCRGETRRSCGQKSSTT